ncbi:GNAT family N-acetyltransferase [Roseateles sp.]|uniref:bifunctional acetate--CoA ligase family protein/GNAT family N-acetyltransferase n=1 Tax=Roseateles sp. TaxID=1971397 RepID=UPI0039E9D79B
MTQRHLDSLLSPQSVAVFGASDKPARVGTTVWRNLLAGGFKGQLAAVNPRLRILDGQPCFGSADALPFVPDLAVLCTPPDTVAPLVARLGERGTRAVAIVTAGLTPQQKQATLDAARPHTLRLLGPHCIGLLSPRIGLNASFTQANALPGELALVSQSGALLTALLDWANGERIGFSHMISLGEHMDVDFGDLLDHLVLDRHTRAVLLYIESITAPRKFMSAARAAARVKPVIVVKAGRTPAREDRVFDAAIRRAGMLRVDTLKELFIAAQTLARFRDNPSRELMVMTNGGGAGVMVADAARALGVALARPGERLLQRLDALLPPDWSHANPIDIIGDAPAQRYVDTLKALFDAPEAGALLFVHAPTAIAPSLAIAEACAPLIAANRGRVLSCWLGGESVAPARRAFEAAGIAGYDTPEEAVRAFALMQTYRRNQIALRETPAACANADPDLDRARRIVGRALAAGRESLDAQEARDLLGACGIPVAAAPCNAPALARAEEFSVGAHVDPVFGPVLRLGRGGMAGGMPDGGAVALPPLNRVLARELVARACPVRLPARIDALCDALIAVAQMLADLPEMAELEIDPLWISEHGVLAMGGRVRLSAASPSGVARFAISPYPAGLVRALPWQGRELLLRPIRPEDEAQHRAFLEAMSPEDLRMRFFQAPHRLSHDELARLTQIDYEREMAFIAVDEHAPGGARTLGVARLVRDPDNVEAEFALMVRSDLKHRGLGRLLMQVLLDYATARGTQRIVGHVLRVNHAMLGLLRAQGFHMKPDEYEPSEIVHVSRDLQPGS